MCLLHMNVYGLVFFVCMVIGSAFFNSVNIAYCILRFFLFTVQSLVRALLCRELSIV